MRDAKYTTLEAFADAHAMTPDFRLCNNMGRYRIILAAQTRRS